MRVFRASAPLAGALACLALWPIATTIATARRDPTLTVSAAATGLTFRLPDSSRATIASNTTIRYGRDFASRRTLWVVGRAEFEIVSGTNFTVWTETALIKMTGGRFVVEARGRESTFVTAYEGSATLRALNEDNDPAYESLVVAIGQRAVALRTVGVKFLLP